MTLSELLDTLNDVGAQLTPCIHHGGLDVGQQQMLSEADARIAQVCKELATWSDV